MLQNVKIIGDPHIGRVWKTGVPLHRMGDREQLQFDKFQEELMDGATNYPITIILGDLFDKHTVPNDVLLSVYRTIEHYFGKDADSGELYIIQGNHDVTRNASRVSSFDVLYSLLSGCDKVCMVIEPTEIHYQNRDYLLMPFDPFCTAAEALARADLDHHLFNAVLGHWDLEDYGSGNTDNVVPIDLLKQMTQCVITGHVHTPATKLIDGVTVKAWGSMQPMSHAEDPDGVLYQTMTLEGVEMAQSINPDFFRNCHLRITLGPDEEPLAEPVDCLSLTYKREKAEAPEIEVNVDEFSFGGIFDEVMAEKDVSKTLVEKVRERLRA